MHHNYTWGTDRQIFVLAHMAVVNIANYNINSITYILRELLVEMYSLMTIPNHL